jgi:hypothetical protein
LLTVDQAFACARVCQMLSNFYQDIHLFRYDEIRKIVYILAGANDQFKVIIPSYGMWEFDDD